MAQEGIERREFFRISDRLLLEFREVGCEESLILQKGLIEPDLFDDAARERSSGRAGASGKNEMLQCMEAVERKLDTLIDLLSGRAGAFRSVYVDVCISGSGLRFPLTVKLEEGAYLELGIILPVYPGRRVKALCRVVRCTLLEGEGEENWEAAVAFVAISEKDRDALVGYVFRKERECFRMKQTP